MCCNCRAAERPGPTGLTNSSNDNGAGVKHTRNAISAVTANARRPGEIGSKGLSGDGWESPIVRHIMSISAAGNAHVHENETSNAAPSTAEAETIRATRSPNTA
jgi:hypothetical protein